VPEANHERAELRKGGGYRGVLDLGANDRDPVEGAFADGVNLVGRHAEGDARRGRQSLGIAPLRAA
jgi:hypothetical protein